MPFSLSLPQPRAVAAPWYLLAQSSPDTTTKNRKEAFMRKPELAAAIAQRMPGFTMDYAPDFRQAIANSWPQRIDDAEARRDWGWSPRYDLDALVDDMMAHI